MEIKAKNTMEGWIKSLKKVYSEGEDFVDQDGRICREILNITTIIENPEDDIAKPIEKLNEFQRWKYPSINEISNIILTKKSTPSYSYTIGSRIFSFDDEKNQIDDFIIPLLKDSPSTRRASLTLWNPKKDSNQNMRDIPSVLSFDFKIRKNKLHINTFIRSNDIFLGYPANIYQVRVLQKYVADKVDVELGSICIFSASAHIYDDKFDMIEQIIKG